MQSIEARDEHVCINFCEEDVKGGFHKCLTCGEKTALVSCCHDWEFDSEPFKAGKQQDIEGDPHISVEISGHYCLKCRKLTTFCVNIL